jgi:hypothetical protein
MAAKCHKDSVMVKADNKVSYFTIKNHTFASLLASDRLISQPKAVIR